MTEIIRNIIALVATFLVISCIFSLLFEGIKLVLDKMGIYNNDWSTIYIGIIIAILLLPFYYLPA